jgi:hypothetical protein
MRSLSQRNEERFKLRTLFITLLAAGMWMLGCGSASAPSPPTPPPPSITVTVTPASGLLVLGGQATFTATVKQRLADGVVCRPGQRNLMEPMKLMRWL